jgi:putative peptidoglycan lipid II flippase
MFASIAAVAVNLAFNALTYRQLGAPGLAFGTTIGASVNVLVLRLAFDRAVVRLGHDGWLRRGVALVVANTVMAALLFGVVTGGGALGQTLPRALVDLVVVGIGIPLGFVGFAVVLRAFDYPGAAALLAVPGRIFRRKRRGPA